MSTFKLGFVVGRFQHLHKQHVRMINTALDICDRVILMVGSSQESGTKRNPFNLYTRMNLIRDVFGHEIEEEKLILAHTDDMTHEDDHSTAWGDFLLKKIDMWRGHYGIEDKVDCFIYGMTKSALLGLIQKILRWLAMLLLQEIVYQQRMLESA